MKNIFQNFFMIWYILACNKQLFLKSPWKSNSNNCLNITDFVLNYLYHMKFTSLVHTFEFSDFWIFKDFSDKNNNLSKNLRLLKFLLLIEIFLMSRNSVLLVLKSRNIFWKLVYIPEFFLFYYLKIIYNGLNWNIISFYLAP